MRFITLAITALIVGCTTITHPVPAGKDAYMIGLGSRGGFQNDAELLAESINVANAFCQSQHRRAEIINTSTSGSQGWTPQSNQVFFKCMAP